MGRRKRQIEELTGKLEEIIRINEDLKLENAEFRAKFGVLLNENAEKSQDVPGKIVEPAPKNFGAPLEIRDFSADALSNEDNDDEPSIFEELEDFVSAQDEEPSAKTVFENVVAFEDDQAEKEPDVDIDPPCDLSYNLFHKEMQEEISELREQNKILLDEMEDIRSFLKNEKTRPSLVQPMPTTTTTPENEYAKLANSMGKLIVDSQIGAAKIIDEAKKEALRYIEEAKKEALALRNRSDEKNERISKKLGSAKKDIDNIIDKMEDLSEDISSAKNMFNTNTDH